jgi:hypothetical protein
MIAVNTLSTNSVVSELPPLTSTDHDTNFMMLEKSDPEAHVSSQTVSPLNCHSFCLDHQWQEGHEWDDVVTKMGNEDDDGDNNSEPCHDINIEKVLAEADDKHASQSFMDSAKVMAGIHTVPSIDEFIVGHSDTKEGMGATLGWHGQDFLFPMTMKPAFRGETSFGHHPINIFER